MKLGIVTPGLTLLPRAHAQWEETASFADVVGIVQEAERLGYHHCTCSEHVAVPVDIATVRGGRYYDPLATFGALGALTSTIRFAAHVLVLGYHHPLAIAKRYGTLDVVTGGRVVLGVGVGSLAEEFALLGAPFDDRGARADDAMPRRCGRPCRNRGPSTTASSTTTRASSSSRAQCRTGCRCGSAAARTVHSAVPSSSATAGRRSGCAPPSSAT